MVAYKSCKETKRGEATFREGPTNELLCHKDEDDNNLDQIGDYNGVVITPVILMSKIMIHNETMMMIGTIHFHIVISLRQDIGQSNFCRL